MTSWQLNVYDLIILFGIFQAFIFSLIFLLKNKGNLATFFLSLLLLEFSFNAFIFLVLTYGGYNRYPWLHLFPYGLEYVIGPTLYFFVRHSLDEGYKMNLKKWAWFSLVLLNYPHSIYHLIFGRKVLHLEIHAFLDDLGYGALIPIFISLFLSYRAVRQFEQNGEHKFSKTRPGQLKRIKLVLGGCTFLSLIFLGRILVDEFFTKLNYWQEYLIHSSLTGGILIFGIGGILFSLEFIHEKRKHKMLNKPSSRKTYESNVQLLTNLMEKEHLYLNSNLNIRLLEEKTGLNSKDISMTLNHGMGQSFYEFINYYRLKEVQKRLLDPQHQHLTILGIANESGFKSKATFNRIFKEWTGLTPLEYRNFYKNRSHRRE